MAHGTPHAVTPTRRALDYFAARDFNPIASFGGTLPAERILVLAPHPDDEVLGLGGVMLRYCGTAAITVLYISDGRWGVNSGDSELRVSEARSIATLLPDIQQTFLRLPDNDVAANAGTLTDLLQDLLQAESFDIVFTPWIIDINRDHEVTSYCLSAALRRMPASVLVSCYEVMYPLPANHSVDITAEMTKKLQLIDQYQSQVTRYNVKNIVEALNRFRGQLFRLPRVQYAEAFLVAEKDRFCGIVDNLYNAR